MLSVGSTGFWYIIKLAALGQKVVPKSSQRHYAAQNRVEIAVRWMGRFEDTYLRVIFRGPILACF